jgi:hypothetical protein
MNNRDLFQSKVAKKIAEELGVGKHKKGKDEKERQRRTTLKNTEK